MAAIYIVKRDRKTVVLADRVYEFNDDGEALQFAIDKAAGLGGRGAQEQRDSQQAAHEAH